MPSPRSIRFESVEQSATAGAGGSWQEMLRLAGDVLLGAAPLLLAGPRRALGLLAVTASMLALATGNADPAAAAAPGYSHATTLAGDGSYAAISADRSTLVGCDRDRDGHSAYLRRYDIWGGLYPAVYDPDGAGGACAVVPVNDWPLGSYNICVQREGCGRPVYRSQFVASAESPDEPIPAAPVQENVPPATASMGPLVVCAFLCTRAAITFVAGAGGKIISRGSNATKTIARTEAARLRVPFSRVEDAMMRARDAVRRVSRSQAWRKREWEKVAAMLWGELPPSVRNCVKGAGIALVAQLGVKTAIGACVAELWRE